MPRTLQRKKALEGSLTMTQYGYDVYQITRTPEMFANFYSLTLKTGLEFLGDEPGTVIRYVNKILINGMSKDVQEDGTVVYTSTSTHGSQGYPWALYQGLDGLHPTRYFQIPSGDVPVRTSTEDDDTILGKLRARFAGWMGE